MFFKKAGTQQAGVVWEKKRSLADAFAGYLNPAVYIFLFLGFSCGLPQSLIGYSLIMWMKDVGVGLPVIGFFALVMLPYNFKFLWAPFVDKVRIPILADKIGAKKAWLLCFQTGLIFSVCGLAMYAPHQNTWLYGVTLADENGANLSYAIPMQTYIFAVLTAFFAASQDIVVDALRINTLTKEELGEGAGMYQFGYRMGMLLAGAGVVAGAVFIGWHTAYLFVGLILVTGMISTFFVKEPAPSISQEHRFWHDMVIAPFLDFMQKSQWLWLLIFIVLYKLCNAVLGRMALPFYQDMGFSNGEIALFSGIIGPWVTITGVAIGGALAMRYQILKLLFVLGCVEILTSVAFAVFSLFPQSLVCFLMVILFDNIVGGMGGAVFVAFLSRLCSKKYAATQYSLLSSLMMLAVSVVAVYSGVWAQKMGWFHFFLFTGALMGPALVLLGCLIHKKESV